MSTVFYAGEKVLVLVKVRIEEALVQYRDRILGSRVRGMIVDDVELILDTCNKDRSVRCLLYVHFIEPDLPTNMNADMRLYHRLSDDVCNARIVCLGVDEMIGRLTGEIETADSDWTLSDEEWHKRDEK